MDWNGTLDVASNDSTSESSMNYHYDYEDYYLWKHNIGMLWKVTGPIILILGTFGNAAIILVLRKMLSDSSAFPLLFMALAVTDLLLLYASLLPRWVAEQFTYWLIDASSAACKMLTWMEYALKTLSAWLLAAMTAQRAITIVWPIQIRKMKPRRQALITIAVLVVVCFAFNTYTLHGMHTRHGNDLDFCFWLMGFEFGPYVHLQWIEFLLNSCFPSVIMIVCNWLMIRAVVRSTELSRRMSGLRNTDSSNVQASRVTLTLIVVSLTFIVLTSPYCVMLIVQGQKPDWKSDHEFIFWFNVTHVMWITNSAVNFFLYILTGSRFREEGKRMFIRPERRSSRSSSSTVETGSHSHHVMTTDF